MHHLTSESSNARKGIKTDLVGGWTPTLHNLSESSNARKGIKTRKTGNFLRAPTIRFASESSNARKGIKTNTFYFLNDLYSDGVSESSNARKGIKTNFRPQSMPPRPKPSESSNARKGIKTEQRKAFGHKYGRGECQNHRMPGRALRQAVMVFGISPRYHCRQNHRMPGRALRQ